MRFSPTRLSILTFQVILILALGNLSTAQTVRDLYNFAGANGSANPFYVTPTQGRDGALYGTDYEKTGGNGSIFRLTTAGVAGSPHVYDGLDGSNPLGGVVLGSDGNLYGTTAYGGSQNDGTLFRLGSHGTYLVLHEFQGGTDGMVPTAAPIQGSDGNFYGTTFGLLGGVNSTVYKYTSSGNLTTIYQFDQNHGQFVEAPLIQGSDGNLYGTAAGGGANNCGTIFKLTTSGTMLWYYSFPCGPWGAVPFAPLVQASDGNFYGTTDQGGNAGGEWGTIFKLDPKGNVSVLHSFNANGRDGYGAVGGLVQGTDGKLYGTTTLGGKYGCGALFQITTGGDYTLLYSFPSQLGTSPFAAPVQDTNGLFYGTTSAGGKFGFGSVYSLDMGLGSFITLVRYQGKIGATAQILGQGFTGTSSVTFNGVAASSFKVVSDTYMTAVVPSGAKTGPVVVTTPSDKLTSNKNFRIFGTASSATMSRPVRARKNQ